VNNPAVAVGICPQCINYAG